MIHARHWTLLASLCACLSGCVGPAIIPEGDIAPGIRTIGVVPVEVMPLVLHPETQEDRAAINAVARAALDQTAAQTPGAVPGTSLMLAPVQSIRVGASVIAIVGGAGLLGEAGAAGREVFGERAVLEIGSPSENWLPTAEFAKTAVAALQRGSNRQGRIIDGYLKPPIGNRGITWHMEDWLGPLRRLYSSEISNVDYTVIGAGRVDAVLEVGVLNYEYWQKRLVLQVFVRLIDLQTRRVLARTRHFVTDETGPLAPLLRNDAKGMQRLVVETGNRLLVQCLIEIRLISGY